MNRLVLRDTGCLPYIKETYDALSMNLMTHATPTLTNAGTNGEQYLSCFLLGGEDSLESITKLLSDAATISKYSGGIGFWWNLRSSGSVVRGVNGISRGQIPYLKVAEAYALAVDQGGKRPGSFAHYLQPHHPDFVKWVELKRPTTGDIKHLFYGIWTSDLFMRYCRQDKMWYFFNPNHCPELYGVYGTQFEEAYELAVAEKRYTTNPGPMPARLVMEEICKTQIQTGMPYLLFADAINRKNNMSNVYPTNSSNLCVTGDTKILTRSGWEEIRTLDGQTVDIWNGEKWSLSPIRKTNNAAEILAINFSDGSQLNCTPYHKFKIQLGYKQKTVVVEAKDLVKDTKLIKIPYLPVIDGPDNAFKYPYTAGFFAGDGTYHTRTRAEKRCKNTVPLGENYCGKHIKKWSNVDVVRNHDGMCNATSNAEHPKIQLYGDKRQLAPYLEHIGEITTDGIKDVLWIPIDVSDKNMVPLDGTLQIKLQWLAGLSDSDGSISSDCLQISSVDKLFLQNVKLMCQTLGVHPKIGIMHPAGTRTMPDGKGGSKEYCCKQSYRLVFSKCDTYSLYKELNFTTHRLVVDTTKKPQRDASRFISVTSVVPVNGLHETYCFNEPELNMGMFNGVYTMNCAEITIPSSSIEYACCTLGTLCLGAYVRERSDCDCMNGIHTRNCNITTWYDFDELRRVVRIMTRNLNKIIDINMYPVPETRRSNIKYRPLGIGIQGLADAFIRMGYKFTSTEAKTLNVQIAETIQWAALSESCELAKSQGPYGSFWGSPASKGIMQHDMWEYTGPLLNDWDTLKRDIMEHGLRNALLVALPPTASTSQIQNQCECFEPFMSNFYARKTKAGTYTMLNDYLINVMIRYDLWTPEIREAFIKMKGSIQYDVRDPRTHVFESIPSTIRDLGMTVWELNNKELILMDRDRARWVCQTMSSNRFVKAPTVAKLSAMHMYCHSLGLKTGMYYLRMIGASEATQFAGTIKAKSEKPRSPRKLKAEIIDDSGPSCTREGGCSG
jgi:ribonucleoside-diphosphate reductase alpha chain